MRLERQAVYSVEGVASIPGDVVPVVARITRHLNTRVGAGPRTATLAATLTKHVDEMALFSDRRAAIANLILNGGLPRAEEPGAVELEVEAIREARRRQHRDGMFLITTVPHQ